LAEAIDLQPPIMPEDGHTTRVTTGDENASALTGKDSSLPESIWDDEDTKSFYESLPDLRSSFYLQFIHFHSLVCMSLASLSKT
jgi:regulator of nonsense transcripts 2